MSGIKIIAIFVTCFVNAPLSVVPQAIDRQSLVTRHNVNLTRPDPLTPLSVGNGEFAFTADITGLQTFPDYHESGMPLGTQSNWGWHTLPSEEAGKLTDVLEEYTVGSRKVPYAEDGRSGAYSPAGAWLRANPHRLHLGRIGLTFRLLDRRPVLTGLTAPEKPLYVGAGLPTSPYVIEDHTRIEDIGNPTQTLDLWTGLLTSRFEVHGAKVTVETVVIPRTTHSRCPRRLPCSQKAAWPFHSASHTAPMNGELPPTGITRTCTAPAPCTTASPAPYPAARHSN